MEHIIFIYRTDNLFCVIAENMIDIYKNKHVVNDHVGLLSRVCKEKCVKL